MSQKEDKKKKKKDQSWLEAQMFAFMQHCMKEALEMALDEVENKFKN